MTFRHSKKWYFWASWIARVLGAVLCIAPALVATIIKFPVMVSRNTDSTISLFFVLALVISLAVVLSRVVKAFKSNALLSVAVVLAALAGVFYLGYTMEKETLLGLATVAACGAVGVLLGCGCFKLYDIWHDLYKNCGEVYITNGTDRS